MRRWRQCASACPCFYDLVYAVVGESSVAKGNISETVTVGGRVLSDHVMRRVIREPLLHFALLGLVIFGLNTWLDDTAVHNGLRIELTAADIGHLRTLWQRTWQRPPTADELRGAIEDRVREEILYREALAMGLDKDDTVVRRRLMQKLKFLSEDLMAGTEPTVDELQRYFREHRERYREPVRLQFSQVFFNVDRHGAKAAGMAREALESLTARGASANAGQALGDRLLTLVYDYPEQSVEDVARVFGDDFARQVVQLPVGGWQGPVRSGYGLHLVYIKDRRPGLVPTLASVQHAVLRDYEQAKREEAAEDFYERLRARYDIVIDQTALESLARGRSLAEAAR
ncbi:hypothetical protein YTPLAS18_28690 [Nitrospira sp.]|nr:hypothetical protein YTPLAS18_28690 [Nitrospira sp.]